MGSVRGVAELETPSPVSALPNVQLCPDAELDHLLAELETRLVQLAYAQSLVIAELDARGAARQIGLRDTAALIADLLVLPRSEAAAKVRLARNVGPRRALTGEALPARLPGVARSLEDGQMSLSQASVVGRTVDAIPPGVLVASGRRGLDVVADVEALLVDQAVQLPADRLGQVAVQVLARLDQDGPEPDDSVAQRRRFLSFVTRPDGSATVRGELTAESAATWITITDSLSAPSPAADGEPDRRTAGQRRHDGFADAGRRLLRSGELPDSGATPTSLVLTIHEGAAPIATIPAAASTAPATATAPTATTAPTGPTGPSDGLRLVRPVSVNSSDGDDGRAQSTTLRMQSGRRLGYACTQHGDLVPPAAVRRVVDQTEVTVCVLNASGGVAGYGRTRRFASVGQRRALAARDGGCSFPGCTMPASWCEAHHVVSWLDGGATDLDNLTLLCGRHHREFEKLGWECRMADGAPEWIPPPWRDPDRIPLRNSAHHLARLPHERSAVVG